MPAGRRERSVPARFARTARINQVLHEVLADEIERLADADERLRLLTITAVSVAGDLRAATVYLASLPDGAAEALDYQRIHLQKVVAGQVRMKWTPHLRFEADPVIDTGNRIEEILRQINHGGSAAVPGDSGEGSDEPQ